MSRIKDSFLKANQYFKQGDYENARALYKEIIKINPYLIQVWNNLGTTYIKLNNFEGAIEILEKALKFEPEDESVWRNLGIAYFYKTEYDKAIEIFKKCLNYTPNNEILWCNMGVAYAYLGNQRLAIDAYKHALDLNDSYKIACKNLCLLYMKMGVDYDYNSIKINSDVAWFFLSKALMRSGLFEDALDACNRALRKNPSYQAAHIIKNKIKNMIKEKETEVYEKTLTKHKKETKEEIKKDSYYERFKKVQTKFRKRLELERDIREEESDITIDKKGIIDDKNIEILEPKNHEILKKKDEKIKKKPVAIQSNHKKKLIFMGDKYIKIEDCNFVIDGANIAMDSKSPEELAKISNLELLKKKLNFMGIKNYIIISDRTLYYKIDNKEAYSNMVQDREIYETPGGIQADYYILQYAKENNAYIISNDMFRDFYEYFGREWINNRRITFKMIKDTLFLDKIFTVS